MIYRLTIQTVEVQLFHCERRIGERLKYQMIKYETICFLILVQ
nr:MAG TPA: hypothetical protein [Bacteriophage sp.]